MVGRGERRVTSLGLVTLLCDSMRRGAEDGDVLGVLEVREPVQYSPSNTVEDSNSDTSNVLVAMRASDISDGFVSIEESKFMGIIQRLIPLRFGRH